MISTEVITKMGLPGTAMPGPSEVLTACDSDRNNKVTVISQGQATAPRRRSKTHWAAGLRHTRYLRIKTFERRSLGTDSERTVWIKTADFRIEQ